MKEQKTGAPVVTADSKAILREESPNILVIDDDRVLLDLFGKVLKKLGFRVSLINNGKDAIDLVRKTIPDIVLLDVKMPGMDGISVLKEIKAQDSDIEVIIMTGFASLDSAVEALKYGAFDYIKKPFDSLDQVVDAVRRGWESRRPRLQRRNLKISQERRIYELKVLHNINRRIGFCSDRKEIMTQFLDSLSQIIGYDLAISLLSSGSIRTEASKTKEFILQVVNPVSASFVEEAKCNLIEAYNSVSHLRISREIVFDRVLGKENIKSTESIEQENQSGLTTSMNHPVHTAESLGWIAQRLNSFLNVPLMNNGNMVGMINVSSHRDGVFSPDDIRLIYTCISQVPSTIQRLNGLKATERSRMDKLAECMSEGVIIFDENFEVVLANGAAQKILGTKNLDLLTIQNALGLDLKRFKAQSEKKDIDSVTKEAKIQSENYKVVASIIGKTAETFMGFVISIRKSTT